MTKAHLKFNDLPGKIQVGFKLFEQNIKTGELYPLFIGKNTPIALSKWLPAENILEHKGFAHRPGWHIGSIPSAPWLMSQDGTYKSQRGKQFQRKWCIVIYGGHDYTSDVSKLPRKCFTDRLPTKGYYKFRESAGRDWVISDNMYVACILSEQERLEYLSDIQYSESQAFQPYKLRFQNRIKNKKE